MNSRKLNKLTQETVNFGRAAIEAINRGNSKESEFSPEDHSCGGTLASYDRAAEEIVSGIKFASRLSSASRQRNLVLLSELTPKTKKDLQRVIRRLRELHNRIQRTLKRAGVDLGLNKEGAALSFCLFGLQKTVENLQESIEPTLNKSLGLLLDDLENR